MVLVNELSIEKSRIYFQFFILNWELIYGACE